VSNPNVTVAVQRQFDQANRARHDLGNEDGYLVATPDELNNQDEIGIPANTSRRLWEKLAGDTIADDWTLLYVEARGAQLTLQLTALDNADANPRILTLPLAPNLPFMVGSRLAWDIDGSGAYYVSDVTVLEQLGSPSASVAFTFSR